MKRFLCYGLFLLIVNSCKEKSAEEKYQALVKKELASGKKMDSIFFGIRLGMVRKDFYVHCWEMNKKGMFSDGRGNEFVLYKLNKELNYPADMNFYPDFKDSVITRMRVNVQYQGWAPWNKHLGADSLLPDVLNMYKKWYPTGNDFIRLQDPKKGIEYVKVDGNRQITINKADDIMVNVLFEDLNDKKIDEKLK